MIGLHPAAEDASNCLWIQEPDHNSETQEFPDVSTKVGVESSHSVEGTEKKLRRRKVSDGRQIPTNSYPIEGVDLDDLLGKTKRSSQGRMFSGLSLPDMARPREKKQPRRMKISDVKKVSSKSRDMVVFLDGAGQTHGAAQLQDIAQPNSEVFIEGSDLDRMLDATTTVDSGRMSDGMSLPDMANLDKKQTRRKESDARKISCKAKIIDVVDLDGLLDETAVRSNRTTSSGMSLPDMVHFEKKQRRRKVSDSKKIFSRAKASGTVNLDGWLDESKPTRRGRRSSGRSLPDMSSDEKKTTRRRRVNDAARQSPKSMNRRTLKLTKVTNLKPLVGSTDATKTTKVSEVSMMSSPDDANASYSSHCASSCTEINEGTISPRSSHGSAHARLSMSLNSPNTRKGRSRSRSGGRSRLDDKNSGCIKNKARASDCRRKTSNAKKANDSDSRSVSERSKDRTSHRIISRSSDDDKMQSEVDAGTWLDGFLEAAKPGPYAHLAFTESDTETDTDSDFDDCSSATSNNLSAASPCVEDKTCMKSPAPTAPRIRRSKHAIESRPRAVKTVRTVVRCSRSLLDGSDMPAERKTSSNTVEHMVDHIPSDSTSECRAGLLTANPVHKMEVSRLREDCSDSEIMKMETNNHSSSRRGRKKNAGPSNEDEVVDLREDQSDASVNEPSRRRGKKKTTGPLSKDDEGVDSSNGQQRKARRRSLDSMKEQLLAKEGIEMNMLEHGVKRSSSCGNLGQFSRDEVNILEERVRRLSQDFGVPALRQRRVGRSSSCGNLGQLSRGEDHVPKKKQRSLSQDFGVAVLQPREKEDLEAFVGSEFSVNDECNEDLASDRDKKHQIDGKSSCLPTTLQNSASEELPSDDDSENRNECDESLQKPSSARFHNSVPKDLGPGLSTPSRKTSFIKDGGRKICGDTKTPTAETGVSDLRKNMLPSVPFCHKPTDSTSSPGQKASKPPPTPVRKLSRKSNQPFSPTQRGSQPPNTPVRKLSRKSTDSVSPAAKNAFQPSPALLRKTAAIQASCLPPLTPLRKLSRTSTDEGSTRPGSKVNQMLTNKVMSRRSESRWSSEQVLPLSSHHHIENPCFDPDEEENRLRKARPTKEERAQGVESRFNDLEIFDGNNSIVSDITDCWSIAQSSVSSKDSEARPRGGGVGGGGAMYNKDTSYGGRECGIINEGSPAEVGDCRWGA